MNTQTYEKFLGIVLISKPFLNFACSEFKRCHRKKMRIFYFYHICFFTNLYDKIPRGSIFQIFVLSNFSQHLWRFNQFICTDSSWSRKNLTKMWLRSNIEKITTIFDINFRNLRNSNCKSRALKNVTISTSRKIT